MNIGVGLARLLLVASVFFVGLCCIWVFAPRSWHYGSTQVIYPVQTSFCNKYKVCDVSNFLDPVKLRVDKNLSQVVWQAIGRGEFGTWDGCAIIDKHNWRCGEVVSMVNGLLESRHPSVHFATGGDWENTDTPLSYISGWSYRLYWLLSFLPDLR